jgi:outer membrane protein assembly factor BamB/predicted MPP superfamily phosphohydrolase
MALRHNEAQRMLHCVSLCLFVFVVPKKFHLVILYFQVMKFILFLLWFFTCPLFADAQSKPFRFAFISDTHIGSPNGSAEEDLMRTVRDINSMKDVDFVVITGDITELGTNPELKLAKKILDSLRIPWYIIPGNHDTGWSESGGLDFTKIFGADKFYFQHNGIHFIGCASGPYVRMSDGHVPREAMNWMKDKLSKIKNDEPIIFLNHYPLDAGLDNWYEVIDMLRKKNTVLALCGHGHSNRPVAADDIPAVMGRSNLRAKALYGGYNLVDVRMDSFVFTERNPVTTAENKWQSVANQKHAYSDKPFPRPDYSMNETKAVKTRWTFQSEANVISTPAVLGNLVVFGNQSGTIQALDKQTGTKQWKYQTRGPIFSSPATSINRIIMGSADGNIYCLNKNGKLLWKFATEGPVLGAPFIQNNIVYIGGSDSNFRAINIATGKQLWAFKGLEGPVVSQPVINNDVVIFGAWDRNLYALDKNSGTLLWKWNNGSPVRNYSPASVIPVIKDDVVYIAAPDRFLTAIDIKTGMALWRTKESGVRESIGISEDGRFVYGKTMNDTIVAFATNKERPMVAWRMNAGYGYEHTPSMLIEKNGTLFFGTRNGIVYAVDPGKQELKWKYKLDNSMVNTVKVISDKEIIAATMNGKVVLLEALSE